MGAAVIGDLARLDKIAARLGRREVLHGVDLTVRRGEFLAVVGPNGAGKSTLLKVLAGVMPPSRGQVTLADGGHRDRRAWARTVSYLPQSFAPYWRLTVRDLVALGQRRGATLFGFGPSRKAEFDAIAALGLDPLAERVVQDLSGGERGRAMLAWALAGGAPLLAADEPIAALDPAQQMRILALLRRLRDQITSVVVLHDLNLALRHADRIAVIADGRCVACASPTELTEGDILDRVFGVRFARVTWTEGALLVPLPVAPRP